jgi:hypothetical protein
MWQNAGMRFFLHQGEDGLKSGNAVGILIATGCKYLFQEFPFDGFLLSRNRSIAFN